MKKQTHPIVSIIMPVYNAREYVAESIDSIRSQTIKRWELLIIDDHSTDGSWKILQDYAKRDKRIQLFRNRTNLGLVKSLNKIIPYTKGEFVARMDADDISLPNRLKKQIALLRKQPELVACGGQEYIIDTNGVNIAEKHFPTNPKSCYQLIANIMVIQPPVLMARGDIFRTLQYDNHIFKNDDISIHFKLLQHGKFSNVKDIIFKYRRREDSLTHKNPKRVYFLALLVRLNAIYRYGYRPTILNSIVAIAETAVVAVLPRAAIVGLFEFLRFTYHSAHSFWKTSISEPFSAMARATKTLL